MLAANQRDMSTAARGGVCSTNGCTDGVSVKSLSVRCAVHAFIDQLCQIMLLAFFIGTPEGGGIHAGIKDDLMPTNTERGHFIGWAEALFGHELAHP